LDKILAFLHQFQIVTTRPVPLQEGKFGYVLTPSFSVSPAPADLEDLLISCSEHSLHTKFRRSMEKPTTGNDNIDVGFGGRSWNAMRGFHFQITPINKKLPDLPQNSCPLPKGFLTLGQRPAARHKLIP
jgi:hypothetical protein